MANLLKEIGRRVTLQDIIEDAKEAPYNAQPIDDANNLVKKAVRVLLRVAGDLEVALGAYLVATNPDRIPESIALCSAGIAMYVVDYYAFDYRKENDPQ